MTHRSRHFSLSAHGSIEVALGVAMMLAPAVLGFGAAGLIVCASLGAVQFGVGLTLTSPQGRFVAWHRQFDALFVLASALAALALASAGQRAALFLGAMVALQAAVNLATRYVGGH